MVCRKRFPDGRQVILLQLGRNQVEFRYAPDQPVPETQELIFTAAKIPSILKRLRMNGIEVNTDYEDVYTDRRGLVFSGPDGVRTTPLGSFYVSAGKVDLKPAELVTAIRIRPESYTEGDRI